jgi:hypothetical protein
VQETAIGALQKGYNVVIVQDGVDHNEESNYKITDAGGHYIKSDELFEKLAAIKPGEEQTQDVHRAAAPAGIAP